MPLRFHIDVTSGSLVFHAWSPSISVRCHHSCPTTRVPQGGGWYKGGRQNSRIILNTYNKYSNNLLINRLFMCSGSWFKAHGLCLKARASKLMAHGQEKFGAGSPRSGPWRPFSLDHEPWATSPEPWALSHEPLTINNSLAVWTCPPLPPFSPLLETSSKIILGTY